MRQKSGPGLVKRAIFGIALLAGLVTAMVWLTHNALERDGPIDSAEALERPMTLADVKSWGYQLRNLDPRAAAQSTVDMLVVDPDQLANWRRKPLADGVEHLKRRSGGKRRIVLAYVSIGEAESYRAYWSQAWVRLPAASGDGSMSGSLGGAVRSIGRFAPEAGLARQPLRQPVDGAPAWLLAENPDWRGNYPVRFWDHDWQARLYGSAKSVIDQVVAAGFDGVYLDRADVFAQLRTERPSAANDMVDLIIGLAEHARVLNPGFLVLMQNAEELLAHPRLRRALDGVAKEDLFYGITGTGALNPDADVASSLHYLQRYHRDGRPVFVVEYIEDKALADAARASVAKAGFIPLIAQRDLGSLPTQP
jgi:cysteinyl-tRNA synthetase